MDDTPRKPARKIALLSGGDSPEREISLASGDQAERALIEAGYDCIRFDPAETDLQSIDWQSIDACFIALHGGAGEDGRVQSQLAAWNVPYTGSGPSASALAMDKSAAKMRFLECGVPTLPFVSFAADGGAIEITSELSSRLAELAYPLVIKPRCQGSSLGVALVKLPDELGSALACAAEFDGELLAEPFIAGREFTVALLDRTPLPMIEVISPQSVFDYEAKYFSNSTRYEFEIELPRGVAGRIYRAAIDAAEALNTAGLVRVDLLLDQHNGVWVLEVNTIPGMTDHSMAPRAAAAAGIELPALVDWMVRDALRRSRESHELNRTAMLGVPS
jgi:D-alanine-D-alanine ligase